MQNGIYLNIDGTISPGVHIKPWLRYQYFTGGYDDGSFADAANKFESSLLSTGTAAQINFKAGSITAQYSFDEISRTYISEVFGPSPFDGRNHTAELFTQLNLSKKIQVLAGIDHRSQKSLDTSAIPKKPSINITSPYLSVFLKNVGGFNLELGARYNKHSKYGDNLTYSVNPSYLINEKIKVFANIASAFRAPALSELYGQFGANPDLKPEKSQTIEGGVQAALGILDFRAVYFSRNTKDVIIYGPSFTYFNLDKQKDKGVEIEPTINVNKNLQFKLYYTFIDGKVETKTNNRDTGYFNLLRRPKHSIGFTANWQATPKLFVSANLYNYSKRTDIYFDNSTFAQVPVILDKYLLVNLYAEYALLKNKLKVFADLKNLTDVNYQEVYGYATQGININGGISFKL